MPSLRTRKVPADRNLWNWTTRKTRQERGYVVSRPRRVIRVVC
jgi:hypothetical protein